MSVWSPAAGPLSGSGGALVSISIDVEARYLESLLEALARVSFPVNPQIFHEAEMVYLFADGHQEAQETTLVEFPAYSGQLDEVREALTAFGFETGSMQVRSMLAEIREEGVVESAAPGHGWVARYRRKSRSGKTGAIHQP